MLPAVTDDTTYYMIVELTSDSMVFDVVQFTVTWCSSR